MRFPGGSVIPVKTGTDQHETIHDVMASRSLIVTAYRLVASECDPPRSLRIVTEGKEEQRAGDREFPRPGGQSCQIVKAV